MLVDKKTWRELKMCQHVNAVLWYRGGKNKTVVCPTCDKKASPMYILQYMGDDGMKILFSGCELHTRLQALDLAKDDRMVVVRV